MRTTRTANVKAYLMSSEHLLRLPLSLLWWRPSLVVAIFCENQKISWQEIRLSAGWEWQPRRRQANIDNVVASKGEGKEGGRDRRVLPQQLAGGATAAAARWSQSICRDACQLVSSVPLAGLSLCIAYRAWQTQRKARRHWGSQWRRRRQRQGGTDNVLGHMPSETNCSGRDPAMSQHDCVSVCVCERVWVIVSVC